MCLKGEGRRYYKPLLIFLIPSLLSRDTLSLLARDTADSLTLDKREHVVVFLLT